MRTEPKKSKKKEEEERKTTTVPGVSGCQCGSVMLNHDC